MASRQNIQRFGLLSLLLIMVISVIPGCPDPKRWLEFWNGSKWEHEAKFHLYDDSISVVLDGSSWYGYANYTAYDIAFHGTIRCNIGVDKIEIFLDSIEVWYDTLAFQSPRVVLDSVHRKDSRRTHTWEITAQCEPYNIFEAAIRQGKLDDLRLKFYLGRAVRYRGKPLIIDTVYARDPKTDYFGHSWRSNHPSIDK